MTCMGVASRISIGCWGSSTSSARRNREMQLDASLLWFQGLRTTVPSGGCSDRRSLQNRTFGPPGQVRADRTPLGSSGSSRYEDRRVDLPVCEVPHSAIAGRADLPDLTASAIQVDW